MDSTGGSSSRFRVAEWEVDAATNRIVRGQQEVRLEPKVMAVLVYLAERPGVVVSRGELEEAAWTGMVVSYDAVTAAIQKLRRAFNDDPASPRVIETISKKGYRLVAAVEPADQPPAAVVDAVPSAVPPRWRRQRVLPLLIVIAAASIGVLAALLFYREPPPQNALSLGADAQKAVAVLPFENLTADGAQDYFAEGITDDLISSLARFSDLRVIARDSSSLYRDPAAQPAELAERLNARYLLRGSVRRDGERVRINAHLIDAISSDTLWSDSFDDDSGRLFQLQDRVTERIVTALVGRINVIDRQELGHPRTGSLQAYDYFLYGRQAFFRYADAQENRKARESFERAIALDRSFALAHAMLAWTHAFDAMNGWTNDREASLRRAIELAADAIALNRAMPVAYFVRGLAYRELGDWARALVEAEKAIEYDPNYAGAHVLLATLLYFDGHAEDGLELMRKAILLNPHHPYNYSFHLGQALYILRRYDDAIDAFNQVLESNPGAERAHIWLAAALARADRQDDAEWEIEQVLMTNSELSLARIRDTYPFKQEVDMQHLLDGLRMAGLAR